LRYSPGGQVARRLAPPGLDRYHADADSTGRIAGIIVYKPALSALRGAIAPIKDQHQLDATIALWHNCHADPLSTAAKSLLS
jgi:hypothetical protein